MKRARSSSVDSDAASAGSANSSLQLARSTSSSSTSSSAVEEFEEPSAMPLLHLLSPVLALLRETEVFSDALKRLAKEQPQDVGRLTELHSTLMAQHELVLMRMTRESILLKAVGEARRAGETLPHVWMLRWAAKPAVEHGPFADGVIQDWGQSGFFGKKAGELRDINAVSPAWVPAKSVLRDA